jgi:GTPase SAR1 family protein
VRELWKHHYDGTDAIIWCVDSTSSDRFEESRNLLEITLKDVSLGSHTPILILFSKNDKADAKPEDEIKSLMGLEALLKDRAWTTRFQYNMIPYNLELLAGRLVPVLMTVSNG